MHTNDWILEEFNDAPFADNRLNKRLIKIANCFYENPESSIPHTCKSYAGTQATYRFFSNNRVKPEVILMSHREPIIIFIFSKGIQCFLLIIQFNTCPTLALLNFLY